MVFHARLSATEIGVYQALQLMPFLLFTGPGGRLTDRIGARRSFTLSTGLFAGTLVFYGLVEPLAGFSPLLFGGYCLLSGLLSAISNPAIDTFIPEATPRPAETNALLSATVHNIAKLAGNLSTLLLPVLSAMGGFVVNGLLMAISAAFLLRHPRPPRPAQTPGGRQALGRVMAHFRAHPVSADILSGSVMLGLLVVPAGYIFNPLIMRLRFPEQEHLFALTGVTGWLGAILASWLCARFAARIARPGRIALAIWAAGSLLSASLLVVPGFAAYVAVVFLLGSNSVGKALIYGRYLREAPAADRGLLIGIDQTAFWGLATLGTLTLGWLTDRAGLAVTMVGNSAAILIFVSILAARGRLASIRTGQRE